MLAPWRHDPPGKAGVGYDGDSFLIKYVSYLVHAETTH